MKAMVLAAGLGKRLRPLTNSIPKPLLEAGGQSLIRHQLERIRDAGITEVVINVRHLAGQIQDHLGSGQDLGLSIQYSEEESPLETGGGIKKALGLLGSQPFLVVSADTYIDFDLNELPSELPEGKLGVLVMTDNPPHHAEGDFALGGGSVLRHEGEKLTYTGTGVLDPELVRDEPDESFMLRRVFDQAINEGRLLGVRHDGYWCDVGTIERLQDLREKLGDNQGSQ